MPGYSELIKNFEKIRSFTRDFFIYGVRSRGNFHKTSARSYDNERRRIESYLSDYICKNRDASGKTISISSNTTALTRNPLFKVWQTKSFTKNDCFLHYVILDILWDGASLTAPQISEIIFDEYLSKFASAQAIDTMTIRNKLNEYTALGILQSEKLGRSVFYRFCEAFNLADTLREALSFYQNILPAGFLGAALIKGWESSFIYKQIFFAQILDDEMLVLLLQAIREKRKISVTSESIKKRGIHTSQGIPVKILSNTRTGRRYLVLYLLGKKKFQTLRIDYIEKAEIGESAENFDQLRDTYLALYKDAFSIVHKPKLNEKLQHIKMVLNIDEKTEKYMFERIAREGRHGELTKLCENIFEYNIDVADTIEMIPWLRTFIGRICSIEGTNKAAITQFKKDIDEMARYYEGGDSVVQ